MDFASVSSLAALATRQGHCSGPRTLPLLRSPLPHHNSSLLLLVFCLLDRRSHVVVALLVKVLLVLPFPRQAFRFLRLSLPLFLKFNLLLLFPQLSFPLLLSALDGLGVLRVVGRLGVIGFINVGRVIVLNPVLHLVIQLLKSPELKVVSFLHILLYDLAFNSHIVRVSYTTLQNSLFVSVLFQLLCVNYLLLLHQVVNQCASILVTEQRKAEIDLVQNEQLDMRL